MGHKLQLGNLSDSTRAVIEDENGAIVATTVGDIDHEKFANKLVTAVNVMPEVIEFVQMVADHDLEHEMTVRADALLEKLEAVDGD